jgi:hypothetical protein
VDGSGFTPRFRWVKAPTNDELTQLTHTIAQRIARFLERQGLLERDAEHSTLASGHSKRKFSRMSQVGPWPVDCPHASFPDRLLWLRVRRYLPASRGANGVVVFVGRCHLSPQGGNRGLEARRNVLSWTYGDLSLGRSSWYGRSRAVMYKSVIYDVRRDWFFDFVLNNVTIPGYPIEAFQ